MATKADAWLAAFLDEHGPTPAVVVKRAGAAAGYSARTLQRAMASIGRVTGQGPATRWELSAISVPWTRPDPDAPPQTGPSCPQCGSLWPVAQMPPRPAWWCQHCGARYSS
jgi:hypothetical protein